MKLSVRTVTTVFLLVTISTRFAGRELTLMTSRKCFGHPCRMPTTGKTDVLVRPIPTSSRSPSVMVRCGPWQQVLIPRRINGWATGKTARWWASSKLLRFRRCARA